MLFLGYSTTCSLSTTVHQHLLRSIKLHFFEQKTRTMAIEQATSTSPYDAAPLLYFKFDHYHALTTQTYGS